MTYIITLLISIAAGAPKADMQERNESQCAPLDPSYEPMCHDPKGVE